MKISQMFLLMQIFQNLKGFVAEYKNIIVGIINKCNKIKRTRKLGASFLFVTLREL